MVAYPAGIAEDVFVQVGKFTFLADFVVVDYDVDPRVPLILGRPFLRMACALVDVYGEELTLRVGDEKLVFNVESTSKYPRKHGDESIHMIDILDTTCEDYFHEVEGDTLFLEELLNDDPTLDLPPHLLVFEINETEKIKTSIEDPADLELKDLPPHLERVNPKIHEVIKAEVIKLLDAGLIYPISDSPWVSPIHVEPKKEGMTMITNEDNELIPTRLVTGWRIPLIPKTRRKPLSRALMEHLLTEGCLSVFAMLLGLSKEFDIEIRDKKEAENLAADHLSRLENPHQRDLVGMEMNDNFPHESLNMISLNLDDEPPWFADIANYLVGNVLVRRMSSQQKKKIILKAIFVDGKVKLNGYSLMLFATMVIWGDIHGLVTYTANKIKNLRNAFRFSTLVSSGLPFIVHEPFVLGKHCVTLGQVRKKKFTEGFEMPQIPIQNVKGSLTYGGFVLMCRSKKVARNHDSLALVVNSHAYSSNSHASSSYSRSPQPYYVTHLLSVIDNNDDYQGEIQGDAQEDKLITAMMNQDMIQDDRVDVQSKNVGYAGNENRNAWRQNKNQATNAGNGLVESIEEYDQNVQRNPRTESTPRKTSV
ncbi:reverse transcriptase domain-containing protein [Tanacetum coccineum]